MFHFLRIPCSTSRIRCSTSSGIAVPLPPDSVFHFLRNTQAVRSMPPAAQAGRKAADSPGRHRAARSKAQGKETTDQLGHLRERMAKLEGLLEGTARRDHRRAPHIAALLAGEHDRRAGTQPNRGPAATWKGSIPRSIPRLAAVTERGARLSVQSRGVDVRVVGRLQRVDSPRGELPELVGVPQTDTERPEGRGSGQQVNEDLHGFGHPVHLSYPHLHGPASAIARGAVLAAGAAADGRSGAAVGGRLAGAGGLVRGGHLGALGGGTGGSHSLAVAPSRFARGSGRRWQAAGWSIRVGSGLLTTWILRCRGGPDQRAISGLWCWAKTALSPAQTRPRSGTFCS